MFARSDRFETAPKNPKVPVAFIPAPAQKRVIRWQPAVVVSCAMLALVGAMMVAKVVATPSTDNVHAAAQAELSSRFDSLTEPATPVGSTGELAAPPADTALAELPFEVVDAAPPSSPQTIPSWLQPVARLSAPAIGLSELVVPGTDQYALSFGPGWMTHTAFPGAVGNAVVSGHSSTYGGPFNRLPELQIGDVIVVEVPGQPPSTFEVRAGFVVEPGGVFVTDPTPGVRLTLTTCYPLGSDAQRYVIQAELVDGPLVASAVPSASWAVSQE